MFDDIWLYLLSGFAFLLVVALVFVLGFAMKDSYSDYKSQPAKVACAQKQMDSFRFTMTDSVVCIPYPTRQDTLTVRK